MSIYQLSEIAIEDDWRWLFDSFGAFLDRLGQLLASQELSLPCIPKRVGSRIAPYHLAGELSRLFDYACGRQALSPDYIMQASYALYRLLSLNFSDYLASFEEDEPEKPTEAELDRVFLPLKKHALVRIVYAAQARLKVNQNKDLRPIELEMLTGLDPERANALGLESQSQRPDERRYPAEAVKKILINFETERE